VRLLAARARAADSLDAGDLGRSPRVPSRQGTFAAVLRDRRRPAPRGRARRPLRPAPLSETAAPPGSRWLSLHFEEADFFTKKMGAASGEVGPRTCSRPPKIDRRQTVAPRRRTAK